MKLFLTSAGWSTDAIKQAFISLLPKPAKDCSILLIACVSSLEEQHWIDEEREELQSMGVENISVYNLLLEQASITTNHDVLCVCGGNTFAYLDRLRKTGMMDVIKQAVETNQSVYVGISAGSIIAGPDIEIAGWGSMGDQNEINLQNLQGFGLTNTAVFPHYTDEQEQEVRNFQTRVSYPVLALTDAQALMIEGQQQKLIS